MTTFTEQADRYIAGLRASRKGTASGTIDRYQSYLRSHLVPLVGARSLESLDNAAAKDLIGRISGKLAASTVQGIFQVFKGVIASAVDQQGNQAYPRAWNLKFIDLPRLVPADQDTPEIPRKALQEAISGGSGEDRLLWGLLAASGLRVGEALALTTLPDGSGNFWDWESRTVDVRVQRHEDGTVGPPKTASGRRIVDLCVAANDFLLDTWTDSSLPLGFVFPTGERALRDRLTKAIPGVGFHAFRRFRLTQTADAGVPDALDRFWAGHASKGVHERYAKWTSKLEERRVWAERVGLGFELPEEK
jgi:integrase